MKSFICVWLASLSILFIYPFSVNAAPQAPPTVWLDSCFDELVLDTFALLRKSPSKATGFVSEILETDSHTPVTQSPITLGYRPEEFEVIFQLGVRDFSGGNPVLRLDNTVIDTIELLLPDIGGFERIAAGRAVRFESRQLDDRRPAFELPLDRFKMSPKQVRLRLAGTDVMTFSLKLYSPPAYARKLQEEGLALGLYYGVIFVMIVLNIFILAAFRDITHVLYILLVASLGLFHSTVNGIAFQYLWPEFPGWNVMSVGFTCGLLILSGTAFSVRFLNIREFFPRIADFRIAMYAPPVVLLVLSVFRLSSVTGPMGSILALVYVAFFALLSFAALKVGFHPARYYVAAGTALFSGVILDSLWNFGLVPTTFLTVHGNQLGSASGIVLLALALTARFRQIELDRKEAQKRVVEGLRRTMEYKHKALQAQIRPHFLFNVLNTISGLITEDPERAEALIAKLSKLFRYTLSASDRTSVGLDEEIQIVKSYLEIEQIRFGSRLKYSVHVEGPAARAKIPGLIIQPLVENSIKHGLRSKVEGGSVMVSVAVDDHTCRVSVRDTGVGFSKSGPSDGLGHGMRSIQERLELAFPKRWKMDVKSNDGTQIDIEFPMEVRTCVIAR